MYCTFNGVKCYFLRLGAMNGTYSRLISKSIPTIYDVMASMAGIIHRFCRQNVGRQTCMFFNKLPAAFTVRQDNFSRFGFLLSFDYICFQT